MNAFEELYSVNYPGNYRAQIVDINTDKKNGIYRVRVWPFMVDVEEQYLPWAVSNLTNRTQHIDLKKDDWVWVFFENSDVDFPVIFNICNFKDSYPKGATGTNPDYYNNITADSSIDETTVSYVGEYNSVSAYNFGDDIHLDIDEENKQMVLYSDNWYIILDKDKNLHINIDKGFVKASTLLNMKIGQNQFKVDSNGVEVVVNNGLTFKMDKNTQKFSFSNSTFNLKTLIDQLIENVKDLVTVGSPVIHTVNQASQATLEATKEQFDNLLE